MSKPVKRMPKLTVPIKKKRVDLRVRKRKVQTKKKATICPAGKKPLKTPGKSRKIPLRYAGDAIKALKAQKDTRRFDVKQCERDIEKMLKKRHPASDVYVTLKKAKKGRVLTAQITLCEKITPLEKRLLKQNIKKIVGKAAKRLAKEISFETDKKQVVTPDFKLTMPE